MDAKLKEAMKITDYGKFEATDLVLRVLPTQF